MWMGRANSPSSRTERETSNLWCVSAILALGCPRSRRTRSSTPSLPRSLMGSVWDWPSAAPSLNRIAAVCGLPTILRAARVFTSFYPPDHDPIRLNRIMISSLCLSMISGQTLGVCPEGKPVPTFPDHALDVNFQEVVHSALIGNSEVAKPPAIRGEPNGHPQECSPDAERSRGHGAVCD